MKKRHLSLLSLLVFIGICHAEPRPNVVLILVDDLGFADLSCIGKTDDVSTPHIDQIATEGVRFTEAYATAPICNASRIAIMSGRYQQRQKVQWYSGKGLHRADFPTIAETMKKAGYHTGYIGKFHHGSTDKPGGRGFPLNHGFDTLFGFSGGTKHYLYHSKEHQSDPKLHTGPMWEQDQQVNADGFTTEMFGRRARQFIKEHAEKPFYLHLAFSAVHNFTHQLPDSYLEQHDLEKFLDLAKGEDYWAWRKKLGYPANSNGRAYYLGQLHFLDLEIGRFMKQLNELGIAQQTIVIFASDNGGSLVTYAKNTPLKGGKYTLFEGGVRVPMIIRYPGKIGSTIVVDQPASLLDLFPTICELTGIKTPDGLDGRSLLPILKRPGAKREPQDLFWNTGKQSAIRRGNWKLLRTKTNPNTKLQIEPTPKGTFLYDLKDDPGESNNLFKSHPELVEELSNALDLWIDNING